MIPAFAVIAYAGLLVSVLSCLLMLDVISSACPQASALPIVAILGALLTLPLIVSRGDRS